MSSNVYIYILVMALVTYLIRMLPLALIRRQMNSTFVKSFLYYVPYATLSAMTFPAILHSTGSLASAVIGFAVAVYLSYKEKSMITVALCACMVVFIAERFI
ncbi:MAG: AzlD domain-containing protein [Clostridiales bacterium]|nr:AzlD domain-containing protein [Lachnospiraceae bacterium]MDD6617313.1 AzlD domain-containing protein [Clostridiales bacterium]MDY4769681.1 AzlD domain-containing protein [Lachnospiraceae bacterium]